MSTVAISLRERYYCLDCDAVVTLNVHGRCETCQSGQVVSTERLNPQFRKEQSG